MWFKKRFFLLLVSICFLTSARAQDDFCDAVTTIIKDAPNQFRNIRGNSLRGKNMWASGIKVPGTITSRFISTMGLFYEGAFFMTKNKEEIKAVYDKHIAQLKKCLVPQGYTLSEQMNFTKEVKEYKKVVLMPAETTTQTEAPPAHLTIEVMYSKEIGYYTIVMYIFEH